MLLLDVDGVLVKNHKLFSHAYAEEHGYNKEDFDDFFAKHAQDTWLGKTTYKDLIVQHNDVWRWDKDPEELLGKWFNFGVEENLDLELIVLAEKLRAQGIKVYLATNQDRGRGEFLIKQFSSILDGAFISSDIGFVKEDTEFFKQVIRELGQKIKDLKPSQIVYFDDYGPNVTTAKSEGISAFLYKDAERARKILN